jgi:hypothetical protein
VGGAYSTRMACCWIADAVFALDDSRMMDGVVFALDDSRMMDGVCMV